VTSFFMQASLIVGLVNIVLAMILLGLYRRIHAQTRADFSKALMVFAGAFMVQNVLVVYSYLQTMPLIPDPLSPYLFGIGASEAAGLVAIVWTALQ
jgi:vacuolar-type H+-ATPase subunit I/STV1